METRWISTLVDRRAPPLVLRALFSIFRVKICRDGAQVVVAAPRAIRSSRLQPHLGGNMERLVGVVWSSRMSSGCGDLHIVKELHRQFFLFFVSQTDVVFLTRSATSRPQPTMSGRLREERQRWRAVDTIWRLKMKAFSKISL
jgi:hypothetical protein